MSTNVVIVESPAKAKTIEKYLGRGYTVLASYGHVRDLPPKDGSVKPDSDFEMSWELSDRAHKTVKAISDAIKNAENVILATDPDREGEAISWHIREILNAKKLTKGKTVSRVTFNEITKSAIKEAFSHPRELDQPLIDAYLARRALDYLVGFSISPVLWRKLPGSRSAGRVQSVALRLICERESEIEKFRSQEYWSVTAKMQTTEGATFIARLTHLSGNKLDKMDLINAEMAEKAIARIKNKSLKVIKIEKKQSRRSPYAPFITSTLQQEASRKLGFSASQTMRIAQQLYEGVDIGGETVGLITYMRTDGTNLSDDAIGQTRALISTEYGSQYLPDAPRLYKSRAKNAQEAHEAIRPTDLSRKPDAVAGYLDERMAKLYDLVWKRTVACQMENAILDQVGADISDGTSDVMLRATGSSIAFDGFLKVYEEAHDEDAASDADDENRRLPPLAENDPLKMMDSQGNQHFTQPPPRFTEASLVKSLEEKGIGRPSTYASIIQVLQDRSYVRLDRKRFIPEDRGRMVTTFLVKFFEKYVDFNFTASLEDELDAISAGTVDWKKALRDFWVDFSKAIDGTKNLTITNVIDVLDAELGPHFFPHIEGAPDPRICPSCSVGRLSLKLGKFGAFIGCSTYPECKFTKPLALQIQDNASGEDSGTAGLAGPKELGIDPNTGRTVTLRRGPYGPYVQIDPAPETKDKPKRQGLPRGVKPDDITLDTALDLLRLPRDIGKDPETGDMIQAGIGRFGPFLKRGTLYANIPAGDEVLTIGLNRAVVLLAESAERKAKNPRKAPPFKAKKDAGKTKKSETQADPKPKPKPKAKAKEKTKPKTKPKKAAAS